MVWKGGTAISSPLTSNEACSCCRRCGLQSLMILSLSAPSRGTFQPVDTRWSSIYHVLRSSNNAKDTRGYVDSLSKVLCSFHVNSSSFRNIVNIIFLCLWDISAMSMRFERVRRQSLPLWLRTWRVDVAVGVAFHAWWYCPLMPRVRERSSRFTREEYIAYTFTTYLSGTQASKRQSWRYIDSLS